MEEDWELLQAWRDGDLDAADALVTRYFHSVRSFFVTKAEAEADDLTQRTFLACAQSVDRIELSFRAYMFGVARRVLLQHIDKHARRGSPRGDDPVGDIPFEGLSPSGMVRDAEDRTLLLQAIRYLSLDHQIALQMFYWEEMSIPEIAVVLECPPGTVKARLSRGRERLRRIIDTIPADRDARDSTIRTLSQWAERLRRQRESS